MMKAQEKHTPPQKQDDPPNKPEKNVPTKPDQNPDPTKIKPGVNDPEKVDPTRIKEPGKTDPTRIDPTPEKPETPDRQTMKPIIKTLRPNLLFFSLFFIALGLSMAITSISQGGPHGGVLQKAGNYFIEMSIPGKKIVTYLLDNKSNTISNQDVLCNAKLYFPDSTDMEIRLTPIEENSFTADVPTGFHSCKITFKMGEKEIWAKFENPIQLVLEKK